MADHPPRVQRCPCGGDPVVVYKGLLVPRVACHACGAPMKLEYEKVKL